MKRLAMGLGVCVVLLLIFYGWLLVHRFQVRTITLHSKEEFVLRFDGLTGRSWLLCQIGPKAGWLELTNVTRGFFVNPFDEFDAPAPAKATMHNTNAFTYEEALGIATNAGPWDDYQKRK